MHLIKKESLINSILVAAGIAVALVIAEVFLSLIPPKVEFLSDAVLPYKRPPFFDGRDANGFRNKETTQQADIVAIGDSQTEGANAETYSESWPGFLEKIYGKSTYQLAVGGYGPAEYSYLLHTQGLPLSPKLVIVGLYIGNDAPNAYNSVYGNIYWQDLRLSNIREYIPKLSDPNEELILQHGVDPTSSKFKLLQRRRWLSAHSRVYKLLGHVTWPLRVKLGLASSHEEKKKMVEDILSRQNEVAILYKNDFIGTILRPKYRFDAVDVQDARVKEGLRLTEKILGRDAAQMKEAGIQYMIAIIPTKELVYEEYFKKINQSVDPELADFASKELRFKQDIILFCLHNHIVCLDLQPALTKALESNRTIYPRDHDSHPVSEGYKVMAEAIHSFIMNNKILR